MRSIKSFDDIAADYIAGIYNHEQVMLSFDRTLKCLVYERIAKEEQLQELELPV